MTSRHPTLLGRSKAFARFLHWIAARAAVKPRNPRRDRPMKGSETKKGARDGQR
jgi:hypothetical protein